MYLNFSTQFRLLVVYKYNYTNIQARLHLARKLDILFVGLNFYLFVLSLFMNNLRNAMLEWKTYQGKGLSRLMCSSACIWCRFDYCLLLKHGICNFHVCCGGGRCIQSQNLACSTSLSHASSKQVAAKKIGSKRVNIGASKQYVQRVRPHSMQTWLQGIPTVSYIILQ